MTATVRSLAASGEMLPAPITTSEALRLWHALAAKEAAALYERRDLARFSRDLHGQLTEDERELFALLTKRLRHEVAVVAIHRSTRPPEPLPGPPS